MSEYLDAHNKQDLIRVSEFGVGTDWLLFKLIGKGNAVALDRESAIRLGEDILSRCGYPPNEG